MNTRNHFLLALWWVDIVLFGKQTKWKLFGLFPEISKSVFVDVITVKVWLLNVISEVFRALSKLEESWDIYMLISMMMMMKAKFGTTMAIGIEFMFCLEINTRLEEEEEVKFWTLWCGAKFVFFGITSIG